MFISFARTKETNQRKVRHERRIGFLQCFPQPDPIKGQQKPQFRTVRGRHPSVLISPAFVISYLLFIYITGIILTKRYLKNYTLTIKP